MSFFKKLVGAAAPVVGGIVGGPWGAAIGAGIGGAIENRQRQEAASTANAFSERLSNTSYRRAVADLKSAGINPMLVTKLGGASTPQSAVAQVQPTAIPTAQTAYSSKQAESAANVSDRQADKIIEETKNIPLEGRRIIKATEMLYNQAVLMFKKGNTEDQIFQQVQQLVQKLSMEISLLGFDYKAASALDNLGREAQQVKPVMDILRSILQTRR